MSSDTRPPERLSPSAPRRRKGKAAPYPLENVLRDLCRERGISLAEVVTAAGPWSNRATVYRVMAGSTIDPSVSTLAAICRALDVRPQEVFERSGLWTYGGPNAERRASNAEVRATWTQVACLPDAERVRITQVVRAMVEAAHGQRDRGSAQAPSR